MFAPLFGLTDSRFGREKDGSGEARSSARDLKKHLLELSTHWAVGRKPADPSFLPCETLLLDLPYS